MQIVILAKLEIEIQFSGRDKSERKKAAADFIYGMFFRKISWPIESVL